MNEYLEKMREHLDRLEQYKARGLSTRDVVAQTYREEDFLRLAKELKAGASFGDASFRLHSFIYEQQNERIPLEIRHLAADNVAEHVRASGKTLDESAVEIFMAWGTHRPDRKSVCLHLLNHEQAWIREIALNYSGSFLRQDEYSILLRFRQDLDVGETGGMGGPLRFILRDQALRVLKHLTRCPVKEDDCFEELPEGRVFYKSWTPFLNWFEKHGSK